MFIGHVERATYQDRRGSPPVVNPVDDVVAVSWHLRQELVYDFSSNKPDSWGAPHFPTAAYPTMGAQYVRGELFVRDPRMSYVLADLTPKYDENFVADDINKFPELSVYYKTWGGYRRRVSFRFCIFASVPEKGSSVSTAIDLVKAATRSLAKKSVWPVHRIPFVCAIPSSYADHPQAGYTITFHDAVVFTSA